jgi:hypothetical protein
MGRVERRLVSEENAEKISEVGLKESEVRLLSAV